MAAAPVSGPAGVGPPAQGSAAGAAGACGTTGVEWWEAPWQELPGPWPSGASATTIEAAAEGVGVKVRTADAEGAELPEAEAAAGEQQKNTASRASTQTGAAGIEREGRMMPLRRRSVRALSLVISAIVRCVKFQ
jgi:hypothetical protein